MKIRAVILFFAVMLSAGVQAKFDATIPVLDIQDYYSKSKHKQFVQDLSQAMQNVGFVAIINSNVDKKVLDEAYVAAQQFFSQPLEVKMHYNFPELSGQRGYVRSETAKGQNAKDFKEFYHISREYPQEIADKYGYIPNVWPKEDNFKLSMQKLILELDAYSELIGRALAESIGQPDDYLNNMTAEGYFLIRALHYPAKPPADTVWAAAHTDINLFTILPKATAEGLQVLNAKGEWVDVLVPDGAFIINCGDLLQNITNGVYKSAVHRVVAKDANTDRYSLVEFINTRPNDNVGPLPSFISKVGEQKFANATSRELLYERLIDLGIHSPALLQDFAASGVIERLIDVNRASPAALKALRDANLASPKVLAALQAMQ